MIINIIILASIVIAAHMRFFKRTKRYAIFGLMATIIIAGIRVLHYEQAKHSQTEWIIPDMEEFIPVLEIQGLWESGEHRILFNTEELSIGMYNKRKDWTVDHDTIYDAKYTIVGDNSDAIFVEYDDTLFLHIRCKADTLYIKSNDERVRQTYTKW